MAVSIVFTKEQRANTWARLKKIFKITDEHKVFEDWNAESFGGKVKVTITMVEVITLEEFNALFNGEPLEETKK